MQPARKVFFSLVDTETEADTETETDTETGLWNSISGRKSPGQLVKSS